MEGRMISQMSCLERLVATIVLTIMPLACVFPVSLTGTGTGGSREAALSEAESNLASQVSSTVSFVSLLRDSDSGDGHTDFFDSLIAVSSGMELLGKQQSIRKLANGQYQATVTIPESAAGAYRKRIRDDVATIRRLYQMQSAENGLDEREQLFVTLFEKQEEYENDSRILSLIAPSFVIPDSPVTKDILSAEYFDLLSSSINTTQVSIQSLMKQGELGILSMESAARLKTLQAEQARQKRYRQQFLDAQASDAMRALESLRLSLSASARSIERAIQTHKQSLLENTDTLSEAISRIEGDRQAYREVFDTAYDLVKEEEHAWKEEVKRTQREWENKPYRASELLRGQPVRGAIEQRKISTQNAVNEITKGYASHVAGIISAYTPQLEKIRSYTLDDIASLSSLSTTSSMEPNTRLAIEGFNSDTASWYGTAYTTIGSHTAKLYFIIPYTAWTGKQIPPRTDLAYEQYLDEVDAYTRFFSLCPDACTVEFTYSCSTDPRSSDYLIQFHSYTVVRTEDGKVLTEQVTRQKDTVRFTPSVDVMDSHIASPLTERSLK